MNRSKRQMPFSTPEMFDHGAENARIMLDLQENIGIAVLMINCISEHNITYSRNRIWRFIQELAKRRGKLTNVRRHHSDEYVTYWYKMEKEQRKELQILLHTQEQLLPIYAFNRSLKLIDLNANPFRFYYSDFKLISTLPNCNFAMFEHIELETTIFDYCEVNTLFYVPVEVALDYKDIIISISTDKSRCAGWLVVDRGDWDNLESPHYAKYTYNKFSYEHVAAEALKSCSKWLNSANDNDDDDNED